MKHLLVFALFFFSLSPVWSEDLTYDAYMKRIGAGQKKIDYSEELIKNNELHRLILEREDQVKTQTGKKPSNSEKFWREQPKDSPDQNTAPAAKMEKPQDQNGPGQQTALAEANTRLKALEAELARLKSPPASKKPLKQITTASKTTAPSGNVKYVYIPPSLRGTTASVSNSRQIEAPTKTIHFGITIGTRIPVRLNSSATNVQPGYIQFLVEEDVVGEKKTLAKGSTIFCQGDAVLGSPRLFTSAVKGITKDKRTEFSLRGNIFAEDGKAGLLAVIVNDGRGLSRAKDAGVRVLGTGLINMVPGADITTQAGKAAAELVIDENSEENSAKHGRPNYVLDAEPQLAVLQIEETF